MTHQRTARTGTQSGCLGARPSPDDVPQTESPAPRGDRGDPQQPEADEGELAEGGADNAEDEAGAGEQAQPSRQAEPEPGSLPLSPESVEGDALSRAEEAEEAEVSHEGALGAEELLARADDREGATSAQSPGAEQDETQPSASAGAGPPPARTTGQEMARVDGPPLSPRDINLAPSPTPHAAELRSRRSQRPIARTAKAMKDFGRSMRNRLLGLLGRRG